MQRSHQIAIAVITVVALWLASGLLRFGEEKENHRAQPPLPRVKVERSIAKDRQVFLLARGFTEADRKIEIKAEVEGRIVKIYAEEGEFVKKGQILLELNLRDKQAKLDEAKAMLKQRELEYLAAKKLHEKKFRSKTGLALSEAEYNQAQAQVAAVEREIEDTVIKAPYPGILESRNIEIGSFVDIGTVLCTLVDLDPLLAIVNISELDIQNVKLGESVPIRLTRGQELEGKITFISRVADESTRAFRVEISIPNPGFKIPDGLSLEVRIPVNASKTHQMSPALLSLDTEGRVGVKVLLKNNRVQFIPIQIVDSTTEGVWVKGLPASVDLITAGQGFVRDGQKVEPVRGQNDG